MFLHTVDGEHTIPDVLNSLEDELSDNFIRVHRNALVSKAHIESLTKDKAIGKWVVRFKSSDDVLEVSRRQTARLRKWLRNRS